MIINQFHDHTAGNFADLKIDRRHHAVKRGDNARLGQLFDRLGQIELRAGDFGLSDLDLVVGRAPPQVGQTGLSLGQGRLRRGDISFPGAAQQVIEIGLTAVSTSDDRSQVGLGGADVIRVSPT